MLGRRDPRLAMRWNAGWDETDLRQRERRLDLGGEAQMAVVNRVEGPAQNRQHPERARHRDRYRARCLGRRVNAESAGMASRPRDQRLDVIEVGLNDA